jgi:chromosome segregation ATPase
MFDNVIATAKTVLEKITAELEDFREQQTRLNGRLAELKPEAEALSESEQTVKLHEVLRQIRAAEMDYTTVGQRIASVSRCHQNIRMHIKAMEWANRWYPAGPA